MRDGLTGALLLSFSKESQVSLVRGTAAMPEEKPLVNLALLQLILGSENPTTVKFQEIEELCRTLHHREGGGFGGIQDDGYAAWVGVSISIAFHKEVSGYV